MQVSVPNLSSNQFTTSVKSPIYVTILSMDKHEDAVRKIERLRAKAERRHAEYETAQADYYRAIAEANELMGPSELGRRLGVHRQRVYQLVRKATESVR